MGTSKGQKGDTRSFFAVLPTIGMKIQRFLLKKGQFSSVKLATLDDGPSLASVLTLNNLEPSMTNQVMLAEKVRF